MKKLLSSLFAGVFAVATLAGCTMFEGTKTLSKIQVDTTYAQTTFDLNEEFSSFGIVVTAVYDALTSEEVTDQSIIDSSNFNNTVSGEYQIKVSFEDKLAYYTVTVSEPEQVATVTSIALDTTNTKQNYTTNETFSASGLQVVATMSDSTTQLVTPTNIDSSNFDNTKEGTYTIFVTYETFSASYTVTVERAIQYATSAYISQVSASTISKFKETKTIKTAASYAFSEEGRADYYETSLNGFSIVNNSSVKTISYDLNNLNTSVSSDLFLEAYALPNMYTLMNENILQNNNTSLIEQINLAQTFDDFNNINFEYDWFNTPYYSFLQTLYLLKYTPTQTTPLIYNETQNTNSYNISITLEDLSTITATIVVDADTLVAKKLIFDEAIILIDFAASNYTYVAENDLINTFLNISDNTLTKISQSNSFGIATNEAGKIYGTAVSYYSNTNAVYTKAEEYTSTLEVNDPETYVLPYLFENMNLLVDENPTYNLQDTSEYISNFMSITNHNDLFLFDVRSGLSGITDTTNVTATEQAYRVISYLEYMSDFITENSQIVAVNETQSYLTLSTQIESIPGYLETVSVKLFYNSTTNILDKIELAYSSDSSVLSMYFAYND